MLCVELSVRGLKALQAVLQNNPKANRKSHSVSSAKACTIHTFLTS